MTTQWTTPTTDIALKQADKIEKDKKDKIGR